MVSYNNSDVVQCLRQYDMFANSLRLIRSNEEKDMIIKQLTKLETKILSLTNSIYEEEYKTLVSKECGLLEDEKNRITMLIDLINQRLSYVEKRCNNHYILTGDTIDVPAVMGADTLDALEDRVNVIEKYSKNVVLEKELKEEITSLSNKISLASEKIDINKSLNEELEATFKTVIDDALNNLNLYSLTESKNDIEYAYYETEKSLRMAEANLEAAKTSPMNILSDCEKMVASVKEDYVKYKGQVSILKLIEVFNRDVIGYDELLAKREEVNEIVRFITNQDLLDMIEDTVNKQYNTIMMEQQDINTFNDLVLEKERKTEVLAEIEDENNSDRFQSVLKVLIENEKKRQEKILEEQRKIEEIEKQKRLEIERKRQEEILKRQRIIEEARKKEIEKRTKQLLEEQQNSVLQTRRKEPDMSFSTIKDISKVQEEEVHKEEPVIPKEEPKEIELDSNFKFDISKQENDIFEPPIVGDKSKLEEELFAEFNSNKPKFNDMVLEEEPEEKKEIVDDISFFDRIDLDSEKDEEEEKPVEKEEKSAFPDMSIDEYMRQFNENDVDKTDNIFLDEEAFPTIPVN